MDRDSAFSVVEARVQDVSNILDVFRRNGQFVPAAEQVAAIWNEISGVPHIAVENGTGKVVGFCNVVREKQFRGGVIFHAENVVVSPQFQGLGVGSLLLQNVVSQAERSHAMRVALECQSDLVPFYRRIGFNVSGYHLTKQLPRDTQ